MRTIKTGLLKQGEVVLFDSIKELNIERHHELQKLIIRDAGIGSDMDAVAGHFSTFHSLLVNQKHNEALKEAQNLHNNIFYMIEKINIKSFSFMCMVHAINGKEYNDFSEEGVKQVLKKLSDSGLKQSEVEDILQDVKKNLKKSFDPTFLISTEIQD